MKENLPIKTRKINNQSKSFLSKIDSIKIHTYIYIYIAMI